MRRREREGVRQNEQVRSAMDNSMVLRRERMTEGRRETEKIQ